MSTYNESVAKKVEEWFKKNFPFDSSIYPNTIEGEARYNAELQEIRNSICWTTAIRCYNEIRMFDTNVNDVLNYLEFYAENLC